MTDLYSCPDCGRHYRADKLSECPGCGTGGVETTVPSAQARTRAISSFSSQDIDEDDDFTFIVAAQDRTTYAIRSLALFLFTTVITSIIGVLFYVVNIRGALGCNFEANCLESYARWVDLGPAIAGLGLVAGVVIGVVLLVRN
jgi:predicted secreted protein